MGNAVRVVKETSCSGGKSSWTSPSHFPFSAPSARAAVKMNMSDISLLTRLPRPFFFIFIVFKFFFFYFLFPRNSHSSLYPACIEWFSCYKSH